MQLALNGFEVNLVDLEGWGLSGGTRIAKLTIEEFYHSVATLLEQANPDLPCFLFGHSMGGLTITNFLGYNPDIGNRLAGTILSAPFMAIPEHIGFDAGKKYAMNQLKDLLGEFVLQTPNALHEVTHKEVY